MKAKLFAAQCAAFEADDDPDEAAVLVAGSASEDDSESFEKVFAPFPWR